MKPRNQAEKLWLGGTAVAALVVVAVGYFFLIGPQRDETATVSDQVVAAELQNAALEQRIVSLGSQKARWNQFAAQLGKARQALPTTSAMASFLRSVQSIGAASSARVTSLSVGTATPVAAAAPVPAGAPAGASPAAGASTAPSGNPSTPAGSAAPVTELYSIPITASVVGSPTALTTFLTRLQSVQPRAVLVTEITRGNGTNGSGRSLQLTMSAFVAPATGAAATPAGTPPVR